MSTSTVIGDVTATLKNILINQMQIELDEDEVFDITLSNPALEKDEINQPKLNLFLYQIEENADGRNRFWPAEGSGILRYPPLTLNLNYVLTPFVNDPVDGHRILGEAMRVFHENTTLQGNLLSEGLANTSEELKLDLRRLTLEELTRIWNALNEPYRLSVCYSVRIVHIDARRERSAGRVTVKENQQFQRMESNGKI